MNVWFESAFSNAHRLILLWFGHRHFGSNVNGRGTLVPHLGKSNMRTRFIAVIATIAVLHAASFAAIEAYIRFKPSESAGAPVSSNGYLKSASQTDLAANGFMEISDYSFDIEQTLNIGSQSSGAGAGKIKFNPFSITMATTALDPYFFEMCASGRTFSSVDIAIRKAGSNGTKGATPYLVYHFKLVAIKTIAWAHSDESPKEKLSFEYGVLVMQYSAQRPDGTFNPAIIGGWDRTTNVLDRIGAG